jgi:hypothetical protein
MLEHVHPLRRDLGRPLVTVGVEQRREQDRHRLDRATVAGGQRVYLGPGDVRVRRDEVEEEMD